MSFILDALKKAESERSRNLGPVLMDVRIAPSRQRLPSWAWAIGCVLLANLLVLAWLLLRKPVTAPVEIAAGVAESVATSNPPAAALPVVAPPPAPPPAPPAIPLVAPIAAQSTAPPAEPPAPVAQPLIQLPPAPVVSTAAPELPAAIAELPVGVDNLPTLQELLASGVTLPALQLSLHVYDDAPVNRYVLLNSRRLREGDELSDGIRIERITPRGVILDARGRRFLLEAGG